MAKDNKRAPASSPLNLLSKFFAQSEAEKDSAQGSKPEMMQFKLVFFIVDWNKVKVISSVFETENVAFHFIDKAKGTANSEILDLLGIGANDKALIFCLIQPELIQSLMSEVRRKLNYHSPGAGIAFSVPLSAINNPVLRMLIQMDIEAKSVKQQVKNIPVQDSQPYDGHERRSGHDRRSGYDRRGSGVKGQAADGYLSGEFTHDLIISGVNQGYCDELMNAARGAGAFGGTVLNARGQITGGTVKFLGISVQDEREIILILSTREKKMPIMEAICAYISQNSKAGGMVFSLPVENVMGLSFAY